MAAAIRAAGRKLIESAFEISNNQPAKHIPIVLGSVATATVFGVIARSALVTNREYFGPLHADSTIHCNTPKYYLN